MKELAKIFFVIIAAIALCYQPAFSGDSKWQLSVEQNSFSLFDESYSSPKYSLSNNQSQAFSVGYIDYLKTDKLPSFLKTLTSTMLAFRMGKTNLDFDWDYGTGRQIFNVSDNIFWGFGLAANIKWNEFWGASLKALYDFGKIANKPMAISGAPSGAYTPRKIEGLWTSSFSDIEITYERNKYTYSFGLLSPKSVYNATYSDYDGLPGFKGSESFSTIQSYIYAGLKFPILSGPSFSSRIEYPLGKASGLGYLASMNYEF